MEKRSVIRKKVWTERQQMNYNSLITPGDRDYQKVKIETKGLFEFQVS